MSARQEMIDKIRQFSVQKTLFSIMLEQAEQMEKKYCTEGLTDDELEEYTKLIDDVGGSVRHLMGNILPIIDSMNETAAEREELLTHCLVRFDSIYKYLLEKDLVEEALEWIEKHEAEQAEINNSNEQEEGE